MLGGSARTWLLLEVWHARVSSSQCVERVDDRALAENLRQHGGRSGGASRIEQVQGNAVAPEGSEYACDGGVTVRPVGLERRHTAAGQRLGDARRPQCDALVDQTREAPRGRDVDEDRLPGGAQLGQARVGKWLPAVSSRGGRKRRTRR